jgi:glycosyltransferase involved in cell wall biosynthesis
MKNNTNIAILLASYNGGKFITEQIESIIEQTYSNWTLFINDDGSTDNTLRIIEDYSKKYPDKIININYPIKKLGSSANFYKLLVSVDSDYYMYCDQDDYWLPDKIEKCMQRMDEQQLILSNAPIIVHSDLKVVDKDLNLLHPSFHRFTKVKPSEFATFNYLGVMNCVTGCTMLFNQAARQLPLQNNELNAWHDWWMALLVAREGKIAYIDEATILYRQHDKNVLGAKEVNLKYFINVFLTLKDALKIDRKNYRNLKKLNYGSVFKYFFYKMMFQIRRY